MTSIDDARSSSTNVAMRSPRLVYLRLQRGDDARDRAHRAVVDVGEVGDRALDVAGAAPARRPSAGGRSRRGRASPSRARRRSVLSNSRSGIARRSSNTGDVSPVVAAQIEEAHRALLAFAPAPQRGVDDRLEHEAADPCAGGRASRTRRLDQRLDRALVEHRRVDALAEVVEVGERPVRVALLDDQRRRRPRRRCAPRTARSGSRRSELVTELAGEVALPTR